jgi:hypothetical protein
MRGLLDGLVILVVVVFIFFGFGGRFSLPAVPVD